MKKILVVANDFPYPPAHGAAVDMWTRILILRKMGYSIDLLATVNEIPDENRMRVAKEHADQVWVVRRQRGMRSLLSLLPFQVRSRSELQRVRVGERYDGIVLEADYVAPFLKNPATHQAKRILRIHNEQVRYFCDLAAGAGRSWIKKLYYYSEAAKFRLFSPSVMRQCDLLWFISDEERREHLEKVPRDSERSVFLPTHVNPADLHPYTASGKVVLFVGTLTISHNIDSVVWFADHIHPQLRNIDGYRFQIAGRTAGHPTPLLDHLIMANEQIALDKDPVSLDNLYRGAAIFVNPVIRGAGIKIKVVQALQAGLPVVSTTMGMEGTGFVPGEHLLVADTPGEFTACVRRLLEDPVLAERLVQNAQSYLTERYDMKVTMQRSLSELFSGEWVSNLNCGKESDA